MEEQSSSFMQSVQELLRFDRRVLIPVAIVGVVAAIVLLVLRRKKNGVRPPYARGFLIAAILIFVFAAVTVILLPLVCYAILLFGFGTEFFYAALKSL